MYSPPTTCTIFTFCLNGDKHLKQARENILSHKTSVVDEAVLNSLEKLGSAVNTINAKLEQSAKPQGPSATEIALAQQLNAQQQASQAQQVMHFSFCTS